MGNFPALGEGIPRAKRAPKEALCGVQSSPSYFRQIARVKEIIVFVDESGSFAPLEADPVWPYYLLCMVFHNQEDDISAEVERLSDTLQAIGLNRGHAIHAGPLIRREDEYASMPREQRIGIFRRMMVFLQKPSSNIGAFGYPRSTIQSKMRFTMCFSKTYSTSLSPIAKTSTHATASKSTTITDNYKSLLY